MSSVLKAKEQGTGRNRHFGLPQVKGSDRGIKPFSKTLILASRTFSEA
jgi:hypothetical protein